MMNTRVSAVLLLLPLAGCFAGGRCLSDSDCGGGKLCQAGECVHECAADQDCAELYRCVDHVCRLPAGCVSCSFPNAKALCDETSCTLGDCLTDWYDANKVAADGCEYSCKLQGTEACNNTDDDCDGLTDEDFPLGQDAQNCGTCGNVCPVPDGGEARCANFSCRWVCSPGHFNNDGMAANGCEAETCVPRGDEDTFPGCDGQDDDCDGETDEGNGWEDTEESCGLFCDSCTTVFPNTVAECEWSLCQWTDCKAGFVDADRDYRNGCECRPSNGGVEVCDGKDNDCNGAVDEGIVCCSEDMVAIMPDPSCIEDIKAGFCIDRYEATLFENADCTGKTYGDWPTPQASQLCNLPADFPPDVGLSSPQTRKLYACSVKGIFPTRCVSWYQAKAACENAGKRLCSPLEWQLSCMGKTCSTYPYGDEFRTDVCNYLEYWTDGAFRLLETGSLDACDNGFGAMDLSGNVWEYDSSGAGHVRGGAYNCNPSMAPDLESCTRTNTFSALLDEDGKPTGNQYNVGFRCCR